MSEPRAHAAHFESLERQGEASRFGMWVFLASEALLFGGLFALYAAYRARWPGAFADGVAENDVVLGTTNTVILIASSFVVALAVHERRGQRARRAALLLCLAVLGGATFLGIKFHEYGHHFELGIFPGGHGAHFPGAQMGAAIFFTLYFGMTGLHAIHVLMGMALLVWAAASLFRARLGLHSLEVVALYWHLVDAIWIVLWPLFYLLRGAA
ncbi:MAG TPA: cytochrome c oxidase subunit 3 [Polyangiaceae bacterium]|nr:cytochrome c oxidase subunit 3 [Polyangiaceae bacterium]